MEYETQLTLDKIAEALERIAVASEKTEKHLDAMGQLIYDINNRK